MIFFCLLGELCMYRVPRNCDYPYMVHSHSGGQETGVLVGFEFCLFVFQSCCYQVLNWLFLCASSVCISLACFWRNLKRAFDRRLPLCLLITGISKSTKKTACYGNIKVEVMGYLFCSFCQISPYQSNMFSRVTWCLC